jgi:hypothetical protein
VATSDAERMRRVRRHNKGEHDLCTGKTCSTVREEAAAAIVAGAASPPSEVPDLAPMASIPASGDAGQIELAVRAYVAALPYRGNDPRALLCLIAVQLARRVDETGAVPAAVRELRVLLQQLTENPNGPAGPVDEVRLRAAQRTLDAIIARKA